MTWSPSIHLHWCPHYGNWTLVVVNVVYTVHSTVQISPIIWIPNLWVHRSYRSLDDIGHLEYLPYPHVCTVFACIKYLLIVQAQHIESSLGIVVIQILCILFWQSTMVIEIVCPILYVIVIHIHFHVQDSLIYYAYTNLCVTMFGFKQHITNCMRETIPITLNLQWSQSWGHVIWHMM